MIRALLVLWLLFASSARAQDTSLSARGRQILDGSIGASWSNARQPGLFYRTPHWRVSIQPSWVYFVRSGLGLGGYLGYAIARESTGIDSHTIPGPVSDVRRPYLHQPLSHDLCAGFTAALRLFASGRLSLFARPYAGVAVVWREVRIRESQPDPLAPLVRWENRHELRPEAGLRMPFVYQVTSNLGFGFGPDFAWQRTRQGKNSYAVGLGSWIARSF